MPSHPSSIPQTPFSIERKKARQDRHRAKRVQQRALSEFHLLSKGDQDLPEIRAHSEFVGCWHPSGNVHNIGCVATITKVEVRRALPPTSSVGEGFFSSGARPQTVTHSFDLKEEKKKDGSWSVKKTGPPEWVKASSATYFVTYDKEASRNIEDTHEMPRSEGSRIGQKVVDWKEKNGKGGDKARTAYRTRKTSPFKLVDCHGKEMSDNRDRYPMKDTGGPPPDPTKAPHSGIDGWPSPHGGSVDMW